MTGELPFSAGEARDWARTEMRGVANVIIPSYTADLKGLNEQGIRHDVRRNIELGFWGALLVSEAGTTLDEMRQFMEIAVDEAGGRQHFFLHGSFDTADDIVTAAKDAQAIGVPGMLLSYPNSYYPTTAAELETYTRDIVQATDLAVLLFGAWHWNYTRLDNSGFPLEVILECAKLPNVVGVKYELGHPGEVAIYECFKALEGTGVIVTDANERNLPMWADVFDVQWLGTNNFEYFGDSTIRMFDHLVNGRRQEALDVYWQVHPARVARADVQGTFAGANFVHRYLWKYQAWLNGYNGGPVRQPAMKLTDSMMRRVADGILRSGIIDTVGETADFYVGRNPA